MPNTKGLHEIFYWRSYCWKEIIQLSSLHNLATAQWELSWESVGKRLRLTLPAMASFATRGGGGGGVGLTCPDHQNLRIHQSQ